jgi:hypothetical protein
MRPRTLPSQFTFPKPIDALRSVQLESPSMPISHCGAICQLYTPIHRRPGRNSLCFSVWRILLGA